MAPGGRSAGCKTCRMRHLKCDERHPTCRRCEKAGIECRGYDVIDIFVDERSKILERGAKPKPERRKPIAAPIERKFQDVVISGTLASNHSLPFLSSPSSSSSEDSSSSEEETVARSTATTPVISPLTTILPLMEDDIYFTFMLKKIFTRSSSMIASDLNAANLDVPSKLTTPRGGTWLIPAMTTNRMPQPLQTAVEALSRAYFAKLQGQPSVAAQGMERYGKALKEMKLALSDGRWRDRDVLRAATCLVLYETVTLTDCDGWVSHAKGLAQLVEAQGPDSFQDEVGISFLRGNRYSMIMAATISGTSCFLARPEWRNVPWQKLPEKKESGDFLFEIFASIPHLLQLVREWELHPGRSSDPAMDAIRTSMSELCHWRWDWEMSSPNAVWADPSRSVEPAALFATVLGFRSMAVAWIISVHDGVLILLLLLASRLYRQPVALEQLIPEPPATLTKTNALVLPGVDRLDTVALGRQICQSIRYRIDTVKSAPVAFGLFLPTRMAWQTLKDLPDEAEWLLGVAKWLEEMSGIQFSRLVFWPTHERNLPAYTDS